MLRSELERILKKNGWTIVRGNKHDAAVKDGTNIKIPIPKTKMELDARTVAAIFFEAGIEG